MDGDYNDRIDRLYQLVVQVHTVAASTKASVEGMEKAIASSGDRNGVDHDKLSARVSVLERRMWTWAGGLTVLAALFPIVFNYILKKFT